MTALTELRTQPLFARRLLRWFDRHQRELPWRRDRNPYRIWVSEVMLQQTQVATVTPFFKRFLKRFPTLASLAAASDFEVLRLWEGLGYYRRARNLHAAAQTLVSRGHRQIPDDADVMANLPGVGRYILGAVLSQAFDRRMPILEANSERVLCRLLAETRDPRNGRVRGRLWDKAEEILPRRRVGDFNQAMMELGALVCTKSSPRCTACPIRACCKAHRRGQTGDIPRRRERPAPTSRQELTVAVRRGTKLLVVRRPDGGRWAGLWEFPRAPIAVDMSLEAAARDMIADRTGLNVDIGDVRLKLAHAVNHHQITLICFEGRYRSGRFRSNFYVEAAWASMEELHRYPFSTPQRRVAKEFEAGGRSARNSAPCPALKHGR